jgi:hypothetical protein
VTPKVCGEDEEEGMEGTRGDINDQYAREAHSLRDVVCAGLLLEGQWLVIRAQISEVCLTAQRACVHSPRAGGDHGAGRQTGTTRALFRMIIARWSGKSV